MFIVEYLDPVGRFISTVGFPITVALFVLVRLNGKLARLDHLIAATKHNTKALVALTEQLAKRLK